ncbi:phosphotransferase enzyme family protein [Maribacter algicola]|uniref:Phosphotransferase enzyme family protein n=1 Tax=Meishania litoralis TaxID=3434685 RepID=A0ACC7LFS8_9FLAO
MLLHYGTEMSKYSDTTLNTVLCNFEVSQKQYTFKPLTDGYINDTFLVLDNDLSAYILQRVNHQVFKDMKGLMRNIDKALKQLDAPDYQKITLIKTIHGKKYFEDQEGYWRLMTFIDHSTAYNTTTDPKIAFEAGRIIGLFHVLLKDVKINDYIEPIPRFHDLDLRSEQFNRSLQTANSDKLHVSKDMILFAEDVLGKLSELTQKKLPLRICHNDTKLNNILFTKKENKALCLIDLDTLMKGHFYYDFGDAIRTIANTALEDEQDHSKITFDKDLFTAFVDGLVSVGPFLSQEEIDTVHLGAVFMPFIHGLRALTDYLNDNIYYKVAYENQNLDRCRSLFDFTQKALLNLDYMKRTAAEKLTSAS